MNRLLRKLQAWRRGFSQSGVQGVPGFTPYRGIFLEDAGNQIPSPPGIHLSSIEPQEQKRTHLVLSLLRAAAFSPIPREALETGSQHLGHGRISSPEPGRSDERV